MRVHISPISIDPGLCLSQEHKQRGLKEMWGNMR